MAPALEMVAIVVTGLTGNDTLTKPDSLVDNRYLTGQDSIPFHSDDEELFGGKQKPIRIIPVSLGAIRKSEWELKYQKNFSKGIESTEPSTGDILVMEGWMQNL